MDIKDYNVMIDGINFFDQPIRNDLRTYDNIRKTATDQGDDSTIGCLLGYPYLQKYYKLIAINLSKQQKLNADRKPIQELIFTVNLTTAKAAILYFIIEEAKETVLDFPNKTVIMMLFRFNVI